MGHIPCVVKRVTMGRDSPVWLMASDVRAGAKLKHTKSGASGGKVSHLESRLQQRFNPRTSGQITAAFS